MAKSTRKFVVQHHIAEQAGPHDDLRLELKSGELESWAVPKGVPRKPGVKTLAIQTEPHSMHWYSFSGTIKEGYGKGKMTIVDKGTMDIIKNSPHSIIVQLHGQKGIIKGRYILVQPPSMRSSDSKKKRNSKRWLLWKAKSKPP